MNTDKNNRVMSKKRKEFDTWLVSDNVICVRDSSGSITHHKTHYIAIGCTQKSKHGSTTKKNLLINTIEL